ncbi:MAG: Hsp20 family protein [Candidatus Dadabacteria bacterium]|nr:Hsp20 family protein [Candidatus Dadabacteria bacterium]NIQ16293.1 Hsp20 family protein [Candidatus Dadabacteria bacterium]
MRYGLSLWEPFNVLKEFNDKFGNVLDVETDPKSRSWNPKINVAENEKSYVVTAEVPGVDKDKIDIDIKDNTLTIKGEKSFEKKEEKENYLRIERSYGKFQRSFYLDENVDREKIDAKYKDGVLEIILPKKEEATPKKIEVKVK